MYALHKIQSTRVKSIRHRRYVNISQGNWTSLECNLKPFHSFNFMPRNPAQANDIFHHVVATASPHRNSWLPHNKDKRAATKVVNFQFLWGWLQVTKGRLYLHCNRPNMTASRTKEAFKGWVEVCWKVIRGDKGCRYYDGREITVTKCSDMLQVVVWLELMWLQVDGV